LREHRGSPEGVPGRFAVVAATFNEMVSRKLVDGALACLRSHGRSEDDLEVVWVPGAFELPAAAMALARTRRYAGLVCVGAVIRGETAHFDFVAGECAGGLQRVALETGVPVGFGVLTTDTLQQALDRAGGAHGNKGWDAASAALEMADLVAGIAGES
jgi:6,7-dimethyl-8-ribityllumazine synthase